MSFRLLNTYVWYFFNTLIVSMRLNQYSYLFDFFCSNSHASPKKLNLFGNDALFESVTFLHDSHCHPYWSNLTIPTFRKVACTAIFFFVKPSSSPFVPSNQSMYSLNEVPFVLSRYILTVQDKSRSE